MKQRMTKAWTEALSRKSSNSSWRLDLSIRLSVRITECNLSWKTPWTCEQLSKLTGWAARHEKAVRYTVLYAMVE